MRKFIKLILCMISIFAILLSDVSVAFAETDTPETAAKTVQVSAGDEEDAEGEGDTAEDAEEEKTSERSKDAPVERMDVTEMTEVRIGNYDEWCDFARKCTLDSWSKDKYVMLTDNIECSMQKFQPVPLFSGVFEGNGYTINKAAFTDEQNYIGVFSKTTETAIIRNLNVIGVMKPAGSPFNIGGIVGENAGMISMCKYDGYVEGNDYVGGIAGYNEITGIISACSVTGKVTGLHYVGGVCGSNAGLITGCSSKADINTVTKEAETSLKDIKVEEVFTSLLNRGKEEGNKKSIKSSSNPVDIGGIAGNNIGEISTSINDSTVGYEHVGYNVGGIAGRQSGYIHDCTNNGYIRGRKDVGGIVGQAEPYIRLDLSGDIIDQISKSIGNLHDSIDATIKDTDSSSGVVSARLNVIKSFADKALGDTGYLANETTDYINGVVGSTNELIGRMEYVINESSKDDGPMGDVAAAGSELKSAAGELEEVADDLDIDNYMEENEKLQYDNAKACLKNATDEYSGYYRKKYDEVYPTYYQKKYYQLLKGDPDLPTDTPTTEEIAAAEEGKSEEELVKYQTEAAAFAAAESASDSRDYAQDEYEDKHQGHTYIGDMAEYTDTIANSVLNHADDMVENAKGDAKDALGNVKKMAGDLRDAGKGFKGILQDVASKGAVRFPQLSDEYKLHTNSLVMNIQGMSDNMGFLNNEMNGATDAVCRDLENVNDKFSSLMLLFTDAMDGALDMDYSQIFEDESNDVCEDSVDATIASSKNHGKVYGDINSGGIAGTMAQEYDFDLESDITGVKDAAKKSTYRTKCVIRDDRNDGEIKGRKSYVGGACGLHEIGTILRCSNFAKVSSESSDYVGGIAGRSYSTIRNSYEKGVLSGESYVGGITGQGEDITDCVSMPVITKATNFKGAVAGSANDGGKLKGNVFVSDELAGVDRISMEGAAEPVEYRDLISMEGLPGDFSLLKVDFVVDDKVVASITKKPGEVITDEEVPIEENISIKRWKDKVTDDGGKVVLNDDQYILFDVAPETVVHEDMEIHGEVKRFITSLASTQTRENRQSVFLVDGLFCVGEDLVVTQVPCEIPGSEEYVLQIPDDLSSVHQIRCQMPEGAESVTIEVRNGNEWEEKELGSFGKYVTFEAEGLEVVTRITPHEKEDHTLWYIIGGCVILLLIVLFILLNVRGSRKRRREAEAKEKTAGSPGKGEADALDGIEDISDDESTDQKED